MSNRNVIINENYLQNNPEIKMLSAGRGSFSHVYLISNNQLQKIVKQKTIALPYEKVILKMPMSTDYYNRKEYVYEPIGIDNKLASNIEIYAACKSKNYLFPETIACREGNNQPIGSFSEYSPFKVLSKKQYLGTFTDLIKRIKQLQKATEKITNSKILIDDVNTENIIDNGRIFQVIDCDAYDYSPDKGIEFIEDNNSQKINYFLTEIIDEALNIKMNADEKNDCLYVPKQKLYQGLISHEEFVLLSREIIETKFNKKTPSLAAVKKYMKQSKNRQK